MNVSSIRKTVLFRDMTEDEVMSSLGQLTAREMRYSKGSLVLSAGDKTDRMGLVLSGSVTIESNDVWGNCTILSHVAAGQFFAETYALLPDEVMLVDVRANEDCLILFISVGKLLTDSASKGLLADNNPEPWKDKLLRNLLMISLSKNITLSGRSFHTAPKTARGRILSYLNTVSLKKGSDEFDIPFDRQQLADYLNLERTNMSKELGKMQREGIIECKKSHFRLINT